MELDVLKGLFGETVVAIAAAVVAVVAIAAVTVVAIAAAVVAVVAITAAVVVVDDDVAAAVDDIGHVFADTCTCTCPSAPKHPPVAPTR